MKTLTDVKSYQTPNSFGKMAERFGCIWKALSVDIGCHEDLSQALQGIARINEKRERLAAFISLQFASRCPVDKFPYFTDCPHGLCPTSVSIDPSVQKDTEIGPAFRSLKRKDTSDAN
jgi:hypothetical protein